jgi:hypothetical protein
MTIPTHPFHRSPQDRRAILVFVDGLGLGERNPAVNPLCRGDCPRLLTFLEQDAKPLDAGLGVPGLPQSATGQATLLTGLNAARLEGRHVEGFPGPRLKDLVRDHNIFRRLLARGQTATFANAYFTSDLETVLAFRHQSVTTVATLSAFGAVRNRACLEMDKAVYHDLTRACLRPRGYDGPLIQPREAAAHLLAIGRQHAFTLFEYFQTDRAGHRNEAPFTRSVLTELDEFIGSLLDQAPVEGLLLVLTSDHGNLEDCRTRAHTANPVPFAAAGPGATQLRAAAHSLTDVTPALLDYLAIPSADRQEGRCEPGLPVQ